MIISCVFCTRELHSNLETLSQWTPMAHDRRSLQGRGSATGSLHLATIPSHHLEKRAVSLHRWNWSVCGLPPVQTASSSSDEATSSRPRHNSKLSTDLTDIDMLCDMRFSPVFFLKSKAFANLQVSILLSSLFLRLCSSFVSLFCLWLSSLYYNYISISVRIIRCCCKYCWSCLWVVGAELVCIHYSSPVINR